MSSKRRIRRKACESKQRHATEADAWRHVRALERRFDNQGIAPERMPAPYPCGNHWHVGHPPLAVRKADVAAGRALPPNRRAW